MQKINCNVDNCSHNKSGVCFSARVDIGGVSSSCCNDTCCGSFLDKRNYSDLTNSSNNSNQCGCLVCKVGSCTHNENCTCNLSTINVDGNSANMYTETKCESFERK